MYELHGHGIQHICRRCLGTGLSIDVADLKLSTHLPTMIEAAFRLGSPEELASLQLR